MQCILKNHVGGLLCNHDGREVGVTRYQRRHDRRIDYPQVRYAVHAQPRVDYRGGIIADATGANRVIAGTAVFPRGRQQRWRLVAIPLPRRMQAPGQRQ